MDRRELHARERRARAGDPRARQPEAREVLSVARLVLGDESGAQRLAREILRGLRFKTALHSGEHDAHAAASAAIVALQARDGVHRARLDDVQRGEARCRGRSILVRRDRGE